MTGIPLAIARWYPYNLPGEVTVAIDSEYFAGNLFLNGVERGDRVTIVDDTISTGGTLISLVEAVAKRGAVVEEIIALVEKIGNGGVDKVYAATNIRVQTLYQIQVAEDGVRLVQDVHSPVTVTTR